MAVAGKTESVNQSDACYLRNVLQAVQMVLELAEGSGAVPLPRAVLERWQILLSLVLQALAVPTEAPETMPVPPPAPE